MGVVFTISCNHFSNSSSVGWKQYMPCQRPDKCGRQRLCLIGFAPLNMWAHSQQPAHLLSHDPHVVQRPILLITLCYVWKEYGPGLK